MRISIRRVNEWDAPAMLKLYRPYVEKPPIYAAEESVPNLQEYIQRIDRCTYGYGWVICEIDGVPAGFCRLDENPDCPDNSFSLCMEIYVAESAQRIGVGAALVDLITRIMSHGNRREVCARVPLPNKEAVEFFKSQGFELDRIEADSVQRFGRSYDICCMRRALTPDDPCAERTVKPYLIVNSDYEDARAHAADLIRNGAV